MIFSQINLLITCDNCRTAAHFLVYTVDYISRFKDEKAMKVSEEKLLRSGFSHADLKKIKNNLDSYGGTFAEAIQDLANRFRVILWVTSGCLMVFMFLLLFAAKQTVVGGGLSLMIAVVIVTCIQPPVLSYKSWRYWKANRN